MHANFYSPAQVILFIAFAAVASLAVLIAAGYPLMEICRARGRREALAFTASEPGMRETEDADAHMAGWFGDEAPADPAAEAAALLRRLGAPACSECGRRRGCLCQAKK